MMETRTSRRSRRSIKNNSKNLVAYSLYPRTTKTTSTTMKAMTLIFTIILTIMTFSIKITTQQNSNNNNNNKNRFNSNNKDASVFIQLPYSNPPTVKPPPYYESLEKCPAMNMRENWIDTLCGDLNSGYIPINPMGHAFPDGASYPFEIIKNKTLDFFRRALPILKSDKSLPKVAKFNPYEVTGLVQSPEPYHYRMKRSSTNSTLERLTWMLPPQPSPTSSNSNETSAQLLGEETSSIEARSGNNGLFGFGSLNPKIGRKQSYTRFCENSQNPLTPGALTYFNRFCKLYNSMWGKHPYASHYNSPNLVTQNTVGAGLQRYYDHNNNNNNDMNYQHRIMNPYGGLPSTTYKRPPPPPSSQQSNPSPSSSYRHYRYEALHASEPKIEIPPTSSSSISMPPTPCPSSVEYLTPVFARNHEGSWRYIVQIPREGYFTQTVEVTKCSESACFYLEGDCKTSPRWQSLLVAEMYYPDTSFPTTTTSTTTITPTMTMSSSVLMPSYENSNENSEYHKYQQYLKKKRSERSSEWKTKSRNGRNKDQMNSNYGSSSSSSSSSNEIPPECDGIDHIGCFQVRLFYDWFLIPGSCSCWKRTFDFTRVHNNRLNN